MAALTPAYQDIHDDRTGRYFVITKVVISGAADTLALPEGLGSANHVKVIPSDAADTVPSVSSITQNDHPQGATLNLASGGTPGAVMFVISVHYGSAAGL